MQKKTNTTDKYHVEYTAVMVGDNILEARGGSKGRMGRGGLKGKRVRTAKEDACTLTRPPMALVAPHTIVSIHLTILVIAG